MTRPMIALLAAASLAGCSYAPNPDMIAYNQGEIAKELAGRTAEPVQRCLNRAFRESVREVGGEIFFGQGKTIYKMETTGKCTGLNRPTAYLASESFASSNLCEGDFVRIVDGNSAIPYSQCTVEGFTPYSRAD